MYAILRITDPKGPSIKISLPYNMRISKTAAHKAAEMYYPYLSKVNGASIEIFKNGSSKTFSLVRSTSHKQKKTDKKNKYRS